MQRSHSREIGQPILFPLRIMYREATWISCRGARDGIAREGKGEVAIPENVISGVRLGNKSHGFGRRVMGRILFECRDQVVAKFKNPELMLIVSDK
jgi:hypothetical protein